ncbi:unnamed protein product [Prunus brigantina]
MIQTQFHVPVQVVRSDNGGEYLNSELRTFFEQNGIIHQTSSPYTPQQNGIAERKNRHLLEVARSLCFAMHVPKRFWGDAICTAVYLINRVPSRVLQYQTPIQTLSQYHSIPSVLHIQPKVFGTYIAFTNHISSVSTPSSLQDALGDPKWKIAMVEEMEALQKNCTWELVDLPKGKRPVGCKWVFTVKHKADGSVERYKARLVAKGYTQIYGVDYSETFAPDK